MFHRNPPFRPLYSQAQITELKNYQKCNNLQAGKDIYIPRTKEFFGQNRGVLIIAWFLSYGILSSCSLVGAGGAWRLWRFLWFWKWGRSFAIAMQLYKLVLLNASSEQNPEQKSSWETEPEFPKYVILEAGTQIRPLHTQHSNADTASREYLLATF